MRVVPRSCVRSCVWLYATRGPFRSNHRVRVAANAAGRSADDATSRDQRTLPPSATAETARQLVGVVMLASCTVRVWCGGPSRLRPPLEPPLFDTP